MLGRDVRMLSLERRVEYLLRRVGNLERWQRWAEQRIRELSAGNVTGAAFMSTGNPDSEPDALHGVGVVTTQISARVSGTEPGSGVFQPYITFDGTDLVGLGDTSNIFNMTDSVVAVDAVIQWKCFLDVYWVDVPGSCLDLNP